MAEIRSCRAALWRYFILTYAVMAVNTFGLIRDVRLDGAWTLPFVAASHLTYTLLYLLAAMAPALLLEVFFSWKKLGESVAKVGRGIVFVLAATLPAAFQLLLFVDSFVYHMYHFHLDNGYVRNLITTPGGIESMEAGPSTMVTFVLVSVGIVVLQVLLLLLAVRSRGLESFFRKVFTRKTRTAVVLAILILAMFQTVVYSISDLTANVPVLSASNAYPLYIRPTIKQLARKLGYVPPRNATFEIKAGSAALKYPLEPIRQSPDAPKYNVVFLVAESWRWDMLDEQIMPYTFSLAKKSAHFLQHYSSGHDTRPALFGLFYGLYGAYWDAFKEARQGPVLLDVMLNNNYQMFIYSAAAFTYPEFDQTLFARLPTSQLHPFDVPKKTKWEADRIQVSNLLSAIDARDPQRPFFAFLFFESPHARYFFPDECAIRKPYAEDLNYATMDLHKDIALIKNRYINASNHLDTQYRRVMEHLAEKKLLDSTVVVITGDHGEEFMEKGHWGHAYGYSQEQIRVPLVIVAPALPAQTIDRITSHVDIPATILRMLGVTNPPQDYSLGYDLFGESRRSYAIVSGWGDMTYLDGKLKATFPVGSYEFAQEKVFTIDDAEVKDVAEFNKSHQADLMNVLRQLGAFRR